jgi:hypothetical protein
MSDPQIENPLPSVEPSPPTLLSRITGFVKNSWIPYLVSVTVFVTPIAVLIMILGDVALPRKLTVVGLVWLVVSVLYFTALLLGRAAITLWKRLRQERVIEKDISSLHEQLETGDFFTTLVRINFRYIDKYYLQTQVQADKSFYLAAAAAVVSLMMILAGIVMVFADQSKPAYVTMSAGVLGEFISTVFFYLYNRTVSEMSNYHQKLVLTQNISLALRIAEKLPDVDKTQAQTRLIDCLSKDINMYLSMQVSKALRNETGKAAKPEDN